MEIDYAVYSLSDEFYEKYPNPPYKELLKKKERRYACLLIQSHYGYFICIHIEQRFPINMHITFANRLVRKNIDQDLIILKLLL